jgi:hypothetical protein
MDGQVKRNDRRDTDWREMRLIRAGHHVWLQFKRERAANGLTVLGKSLLQACEVIWAAKRELRASLAKERSASFTRWMAKEVTEETLGDA